MAAPVSSNIVYGAPMTSNLDHLLTVDEVRARLKVSKSTLWAMLADHRLTSVKLGGRRMVRASDLEAFIKGLPS